MTQSAHRIFAATLALGLFATSLPWQGLTAQEPTVTDNAAPEPFDVVDAAWTQVNDQLQQTIERYRTASPADRERLVAEYNQLVAQGNQVLSRLRVAALAAYQAAPNTDPLVTTRLIGMVGNDVRQDDYERGLSLARLLLEHGCQEPSLDAFVGVAAYCTDDFATAEQALTKAQAARALTPDGEVCLQDLAKAKAAWSNEQQIRVREAAADDLPRVALQTTKGVLVIELYENEAPLAVNNFVSLVEAGFYDGLTFHRVLPGFMAQGGCPKGTGTGGPGYNIACECYREDHREHFRGTLSMAHAGRDTGGSQFFLTFKRTSHLDGRHTVFGRVIEGLDVLAKLQRRDPSQRGTLPTPDKIVKAEVLRKRDHPYQPTKVGR